MILVFKQHYKYFHILFHLHLKIHTTLPSGPPRYEEKSDVSLRVHSVHVTKNLLRWLKAEPEPSHRISWLHSTMVFGTRLLHLLQHN